jgi:two-component system, OmpR family, response regulator MprA
VTSPGRLLVVEDDQTMRETLVEVLADEGYEVRGAEHGQHAIRELQGWEPDVIILDLMMPVMDAFEFREELRSLGAAPDARVLILSAARDLGEAAERIRAHEWMAKPFRLEAVLEAIDRLLSDRRSGGTAAR